MTGNEQIQEIANVLCGLKNGCNNCAFRSETCYERKDAEAIYSKGYRKASEVAKEIFDNVDEIAYRYLNNADYSAGDMIYDLNELKKKYTEGEK